MPVPDTDEEGEVDDAGSKSLGEKRKHSNTHEQFYLKQVLYKYR